MGQSWRIANHLKELVLQKINFNNGELNMQNKQISKSENTSKDLIANTNESIQKPKLKSSLKLWSRRYHIFTKGLKQVIPVHIYLKTNVFALR